MSAEVANLILQNLTHIAMGIVIFAISYLAYMAFGTYYNVSLLKQEYDKSKTIESLIKIVCVGIGTGLLGIGITTLPIFANSVGFEIPKEYQEVFNNIAVLGIYLTASIKYLAEAFTKMGKIVTPNINVDDEIQQNQIKEAKEQLEQKYFATLTADSEEAIENAVTTVETAQNIVAAAVSEAVAEANEEPAETEKPIEDKEVVEEGAVG